jgi:ABC-type transport system substrate-binding protein
LGIDFTAAGTYLKSVLERLGYPTQIKTFSVNNLSVGLREADSRTTPQAWFGAGIPLYPAASQFFAGPLAYTCQSFIPDSANNANTEEFCDPRFDAIVRRALTADAAGTPSARLWADADHELDDQAPDVYLVNPSTTDFISSRTGNYQYNPWIGILIDQLWVR